MPHKHSSSILWGMRHPRKLIHNPLILPVCLQNPQLPPRDASPSTTWPYPPPQAQGGTFSPLGDPQPRRASGGFFSCAQSEPCDVTKRKNHTTTPDFSRSTNCSIRASVWDEEGVIAGRYDGGQGEGKEVQGRFEECHKHFTCKGKKSSKTSNDAINKRKKFCCTHLSIRPSPSSCSAWCLGCQSCNRRHFHSPAGSSDSSSSTGSKAQLCSSVRTGEQRSAWMRGEQRLDSGIPWKREREREEREGMRERLVTWVRPLAAVARYSKPPDALLHGAHRWQHWTRGRLRVVCVSEPRQVWWRLINGMIKVVLVESESLMYSWWKAASIQPDWLLLSSNNTFSVAPHCFHVLMLLCVRTCVLSCVSVFFPFLSSQCVV